MKNVQVMVRVSKGLAEAIDICVGSTHSSRPDFVIDGIRQYMHCICNEEAGIMIYLNKNMKDTSREAKLDYYHEKMKDFTLTYRNSVANMVKKTEGNGVGILLSLPKNVTTEIERTVERTGCFKNHQEFIKSSIFHMFFVLGSDNTNSMLTEQFLMSNAATEQLRSQIEQMRREISKYETSDGEKDTKNDPEDAHRPS